MFLSTAVTMGDLLLQGVAVVAVLLAVVALWPVRRLAEVSEGMAARARAQDAAIAEQDKAVTTRIAIQDERITAAIEAMGVALQRNHDGMHTLSGQVLGLRADLERAHRIHPPEQHPQTLVALAEIHRRLEDIDGKLDELAGRRFRRPPPKREPN